MPRVKAAAEHRWQTSVLSDFEGLAGLLKEAIECDDGEGSPVRNNSCDVAVIGLLHAPVKLRAEAQKRRKTDEGLLAPLARVPLAGTPFLLDSKLRLLELVGLDEELVPGLVIACRGRLQKCITAEGFSLEVVETCYPGDITGLSSSNISATVGSQSLIAFVSGLYIGDARSATLHLRLLQEFLLGEIGGPEDREAAAAIVALFVVGGIYADPLASANNQPHRKGIKRGVTSSKGRSRHGALDGTMAGASVDMADLFLASVAAAGIEVLVQPGPRDIGSGPGLPQPPLPHAFFPRSKLSNRLQLLRNPCEVLLNNVCVVGETGQAVRSIQNCTNTLSQMDALNVSWRAQHFAPTAPKALVEVAQTSHYAHKDPLVIPVRCPGVESTIFFSGNCSTADWSLWRGYDDGQVLGMCVPSFLEESTLLLVDLEDISNVRRVDFGIG